MGERVVHIGDLASAKQLLNAEHELVEGEALRGNATTALTLLHDLLGCCSVSSASGLTLGTCSTSREP